MKERVREITSRNGGRSLSQVIEKLRCYLPGWKEYFRLADTPRISRIWTNGFDVACVWYS